MAQESPQELKCSPIPWHITTKTILLTQKPLWHKTFVNWQGHSIFRRNFHKLQNLLLCHIVIQLYRDISIKILNIHVPESFWFNILSSRSYLEQITTAACGYGFSLIGSHTQDTSKVWGMGINTNSQIGYHPKAMTSGKETIKSSLLKTP